MVLQIFGGVSIHHGWHRGRREEETTDYTDRHGLGRASRKERKGR